MAGTMYRVTPVDSQGSVTEYLRDPETCCMSRCAASAPLRPFSRSTREGFAVAPVVAMRPALSIGLHGDRYIQSWFQRGAQGKLHFNYTSPEAAKFPTPEQRTELIAEIHRQTASQKPVVTADMSSSTISDTPQDSEAGNLRVHQAQEVAAAYGVPGAADRHDGHRVGRGHRGAGSPVLSLRRQPAHDDRFLEPFETAAFASARSSFHVDLTEFPARQSGRGQQRYSWRCREMRSARRWRRRPSCGGSRGSPRTQSGSSRRRPCSPSKRPVWPLQMAT